MADSSSVTKGVGREAGLAGVRADWDEVEAEETRLLCQMTVQESLRHLLVLQRAFESQLQQTEPLFRAERLAYLEELQRRLATLTGRTEE
jgi:hypothetical protein